MTHALNVVTAVILVDHGSQRAESNAMFERFVADFAAGGGYAIVEPAHMELAEPSIAQAFDRCVERGAKRVVVMPYFLLPGAHWKHDIPQLTATAAKGHAGVEWLVAAPIALHPLMKQVIASRIEQCLQHVVGQGLPCDVCEGDEGCALKQG